MSEDTVAGEIRLFAGPYAPEGWALCEGQLLDSGQYPALYAVIGNLYGGMAGRTFKLPNMCARTMIGAGLYVNTVNYPVGSSGGQSSVRLTVPQLPGHNHQLMATTNAADTAQLDHHPLIAQPAANVRPFNDAAVASGAMGAFSSQSISPNPTSNLRHDNMMPSLGLNYIIALDGILPS